MRTGLCQILERASLATSQVLGLDMALVVLVSAQLIAANRRGEPMAINHLELRSADDPPRLLASTCWEKVPDGEATPHVLYQPQLVSREREEVCELISIGLDWKEYAYLGLPPRCPPQSLFLMKQPRRHRPR